MNKGVDATWKPASASGTNLLHPDLLEVPIVLRVPIPATLMRFEAQLNVRPWTMSS